MYFMHHSGNLPLVLYLVHPGVTPSAFWPPVDNCGEFEVKDILDSRFMHRGY